jgi:hypothetical protein
MNTEEREKQRVQRLQQEQLAARYGGRSGKLRYYGKLGGNKVKIKPRTLYQRIFGSLDPRFTGAAIGAVIGFLLMLAIMTMLPAGSPWLVAAFVPLVICGIIGWVLGKTIEA